ncbi:MAG TPA: nucleotide exchange factor GrpE [Alphaproteobacteria bacterium]|jgi:molecular chaperone GrpE|nr:nucleotide exchange factor GrpE [Alphaproteobacteria bacterium]
MTADEFDRPDPVFSTDVPKATPEDAPQAQPAPDMARLESEVADLKDRLLRALAETENVRRRAEREREDTAKYAMSAFARDMLSVADNLGRALAAVPAEARGKDPAVDALIAGIELTDRELRAVFERHGIRRVDPMGERFDHNFHQAMMEVEDPTKPTGTVVQVMQTGYVIRDRLLRPAMVAVSKGGKAEVAHPSAANNDIGHTVDTKA